MRIGVLGTARIVKEAIAKPARKLDGVEVCAVASRSADRAQQFAQRLGIPRSYGSYRELLDDDQLDVIYNPLPISLHAEWSIAALEAGKHVLCEKPIASNADEATAMDQAASKSGRLLIEEFHYRYHPMIHRVKQIIDSGEIGPVRHLDVKFRVFWPNKSDIRFVYDVGGGAMMDIGCYPVNACRFLMGDEPVVRSAKATTIRPNVDHTMEAELEFPGGRTASLEGSLRSQLWNWRAGIRVVGEQGELTAFNPFLPHLFHLNSLKWKSPAGTSREKFKETRTTYDFQLEAFAKAVSDGSKLPTDAADGVRNMRVIDAIYTHAGLTIRGLPSTT